METGMRASEELERDQRSPAVARKRVAEACAGLPSDVVDAAMLLTSELVTNAVQHGVGTVVLTVVRDDEGIRVEVCDDGTSVPKARDCDTDAEHGRGLLLLEALATRWGTSDGSAGSGTRVWFVLRG
jgi:anti-sigma regulatory factor (Ser/Thr protein kinase)